MTIYLRQSTASQEIALGHFVDSLDGVTPETGLTIAASDIQIWKAGATSLVAKNSGGATHMAGGIYSAVLDATDTNTLGSLVIFVSVAGALAVRLECCILAANVYDSMIGGGSVLNVNTQTITSGAINEAAIADGAINAATFSNDTGFATIRSATAQGGASTSIILDGSAVATDDFYNNTLITITSGTGAGQSRFILDYVGATKVATVLPWAVAPNSTSVFVISPFGAVPVGSVLSAAISAGSFATDTGFAVIRTGTAQAGTSTSITLDSGALATDNFYNNTLITIISGTGAGQARFISGYVGSTKVATVSAWSVTPNSTSVFVISPFAAVAGATAPTAAETAAEVWNKATSAHTTAGSFGQLIGNNLNATVSSRASQTSVDTVDTVVDALAVTLGTVNTNVSSVLTAVDTEVAAALAAVDTEVAAIKTVTDQFVTSQAEPTGVPSPTGTPLQKIRDIHALMVNGVEVNNSTNKLLIKNSSGTNIFEYDITDNGTSTSLSSANAPG